jgi:hypothetical protein
MLQFIMRPPRSKTELSYTPVEHRLYTTEEVSRILSISTSQLKQRRMKNPAIFGASYRLGKKHAELRYSESDIRRIIDSLFVIPD